MKLIINFVLFFSTAPKPIKAAYTQTAHSCLQKMNHTIVNLQRGIRITNLPTLKKKWNDPSMWNCIIFHPIEIIVMLRYENRTKYLNNKENMS